MGEVTSGRVTCFWSWNSGSLDAQQDIKGLKAKTSTHWNAPKSSTEHTQSWNHVTSQIHDTQKANPSTAPQIRPFPAPIGSAFHADQIAKSQEAVQENPSPTAKSESPPLHSDWLVEDRAMAMFSGWSYLPGRPPHTTNWSSVHFNTGTHRGTVQVYNRGCSIFIWMGG